MSCSPTVELLSSLFLFLSTFGIPSLMPLPSFASSVFSNFTSLLSSSPLLHFFSILFSPFSLRRYFSSSFFCTSVLCCSLLAVLPCPLLLFSFSPPHSCFPVSALPLPTDVATHLLLGSSPLVLSSPLLLGHLPSVLAPLQLAINSPHDGSYCAILSTPHPHFSFICVCTPLPLFFLLCLLSPLSSASALLFSCSFFSVSSLLFLLPLLSSLLFFIPCILTYLSSASVPLLLFFPLYPHFFLLTALLFCSSLLPVSSHLLHLYSSAVHFFPVSFPSSHLLYFCHTSFLSSALKLLSASAFLSHLYPLIFFSAFLPTRLFFLPSFSFSSPPLLLLFLPCVCSSLLLLLSFSASVIALSSLLLFCSSPLLLSCLYQILSSVALFIFCTSSLPASFLLLFYSCFTSMLFPPLQLSNLFLLISLNFILSSALLSYLYPLFIGHGKKGACKAKAGRCLLSNSRCA
ncbi:uncharacterized protein LOC121111080 [Gallus gallus]|uniref:uncharacterized protein LOC121111080 n=1 Tax=Gallus gallus TaxID=9031 RepID=UPI001AE155B1|nr:uncharacterized protein LOC121111080 [Gallus gallus]